MNDERIETLHQILAEVLKAARKERKILPDHSLVGDLGLDSIHIMDFIGRVEDRFDVLIPLNKMVSIKRVKDLYAALDQLVENS